MLIFNLLCLCDLPYTKLIKNVGTCKDMTWLFHGYYISVLRFDLHFRIVRASIFG